MKGRGSVCCSVAIAALAAAIVIGYMIGRPKSLLDYATQVADTRDWQSSKIMNRPLLQFCWLSPTEVLYAGASDSASVQLMRKRIDRPSEPSVTLPVKLPINTRHYRE